MKERAVSRSRVARAFGQLVRDCVRRANACLVDSFLNPPQYWTLQAICSRGPVSLKVLCRELGKQPPTITQMVDRLAEAGLVLHRRDRQRDRRVVRAIATRRGHRICQAVEDRQKGAMEDLLGALSARQRKSLLRIVQQLRRRGR